jgi:predicted SprT family Zn-dependent metalloprotease
MIRKISQYIPEKSIPLLKRVLANINTELRVSKPRKSKLGDFRPLGTSGKSKISINDDLNEYSFLLTLLHELAHHLCWVKHHGKVKPHGEEWKKEFESILKPFVLSNVFPVDVSEATWNYLKNPKASSCSDENLYKTLRNYDFVKDDSIYVSDLIVGQCFEYVDKGFFEVLAKKRKRILCLSIESKKRYLFQPTVSVKLIHL